HRPWSVFGDADRIRALNPLCRVPTLVTDGGTVLTDSHIILDYLDGRVGPEQALYPQQEPARHMALRIGTLAMGLAEKAVSLFYERRLHDTVSDVWDQRCRTQIGSVLDRLETERRAVATPYWFGDRPGHADIAVACGLAFATAAHPGLIAAEALPALDAHCAGLEATAAFREIRQPFVPPA